MAAANFFGLHTHPGFEKEVITEVATCTLRSLQVYCVPHRMRAI